jgi:heme/copper-type cytochrome/quinol oxidase subunit 2
VRRLVLVLPVALTGALVAAAVAAADNGLSPVKPESSNAEAIRTTYWVILAVSAVIFLLVEAALLLFVFRFRGRGRARDQEAPQIHGATKLETSFTVVPVLILAGIVAFVFVSCRRSRTSRRRLPPAARSTSASRATSTTGSSTTPPGKSRSSEWSCRSTASSRST